MLEKQLLQRLHPISYGDLLTKSDDVISQYSGWLYREASPSIVFIYYKGFGVGPVWVRFWNETCKLELKPRNTGYLRAGLFELIYLNRWSYHG